MFAALVAEHRGFFLREGVGQTMSVEAMEGSIRSGGLYFSPVHRFTAPMSIPIDTRGNEIILEPHMVGTTTGTSDDAV